ncbi:MAG TPA: sugar phosphate isomerase/epimerase family protein, partial [Candidatus Acidoferrales bacterium]
MPRTLSTYLFVKRKLTPGLVADIARFRVEALELFCARPHFDYRSSEVVRELAAVLRDHSLAVHSVHAPAERDFSQTRESGAPLSICDLERSRRLEAVDEIKRALDVAEEIPFRFLVQHFGSSREDVDPRRFDAAFSSLEHLNLFAKQRGVTIALENTPGDLATPAHLRQFIADTRLIDLRFCFDTGHAHLADGVPASLEAMRELTVTSHIHDNHGDKDEHLLPYQGTIGWKSALASLAVVQAHAPGVAAGVPTTHSGIHSGAPAGSHTGVPLVLELK